MWAVRGYNGMHLTEKLPRNAASFVWTAALGRISTGDNLIKIALL